MDQRLNKHAHSSRTIYPGAVALASFIPFSTAGTAVVAPEPAGTIDADNSSTGKSWYIYCRDNVRFLPRIRARFWTSFEHFVVQRLFIA